MPVVGMPVVGMPVVGVLMVRVGVGEIGRSVRVRVLGCGVHGECVSFRVAGSARRAAGHRPHTTSIMCI
jgi:hypothetical protein